MLVQDLLYLILLPRVELQLRRQAVHQFWRQRQWVAPNSADRTWRAAAAAESD